MTLPTWTPTADNPSVFARLSGDYNPVHLDEEHARGAGFATVIIHGMNVLGAAARAAHAAAPAASALRTIDIRFANPVLPGETLSFDAAGKGISGPPGDAGQTLPRYDLRVDEGRLFLGIDLQSAAAPDAAAGTADDGAGGDADTGEGTARC